MAWRAFDWLSPIGGVREVRQHALTASLIANVNRGPKQDPWTVDDFDLYRDPRPRLTRAEEEAQFRAAFAAAGLLRVA